jgi:hypothetical protein
VLSIDTHQTNTRFQSNQQWRCSTISQCSATKQSNKIRTIILLIQPFIHYFSQTLTTLDLWENGISTLGAQYLVTHLFRQTLQILHFTTEDIGYTDVWVCLNKVLENRHFFNFPYKPWKNKLLSLKCVVGMHVSNKYVSCSINGSNHFYALFNVIAKWVWFK